MVSHSHSLSKIPFLASHIIIKINITAENEKENESDDDKLSQDIVMLVNNRRAEKKPNTILTLRSIICYH